MKVYSSVSSTLIRHVILRGSIIGGLGAVVILAGSFMPVDFLQHWGIPIWMAGLLLIAWGLIPYRFLCLLSIKPNQIEITEDEYLYYFSRGKLRLKLPLQQIHQLHYIDHPRKYGITLSLKHRDYFLPYFSRYAFKQIEQLLEEEN